MLCVLRPTTVESTRSPAFARLGQVGLIARGQRGVLVVGRTGSGWGSRAPLALRSPSEAKAGRSSLKSGAIACNLPPNRGKRPETPFGLTKPPGEGR